MKSFYLVFLLTFSLALQAETVHRKGVKVVKKVSLRKLQNKESADYSNEKAELLAKRRASLLMDLKRVLKDSRNSEQRFELRFRLANLYLEDYRYLLGKGSKSTEALEKARSLYRELVSENPSHSRHDELLFQLAQTNLESGKTEEALKTFETISTRFPTSHFSEEANIQIAENAFDKNDFKKAEVYYNKVLQNQSSPLYLFAAYKKGWCAYNLSRHLEAISSFKEVISEDGSTSSSANSLALKREALRDICLPFSELKQFSEAMSFFRQQEEAIYRAGLESLGSLALERGEYLSSIEVYRTLLNLDANFLKNPDYSLSLVEAYRQKGEAEKALTELTAALENYLGNSTWKEIFSADVKNSNAVRLKFEEVTRKLGQETHLQAQKTKSEGLYQLAKSTYETYLQYFPLDPEAAKTRFYLAEIFFHQKDYSSASSAYYEVYQGSSLAEETKYSSLRYAVLARYAAINQERKKGGLPELSSAIHEKLTSSAGEPTEVDPYSENETSFLSTGHELVQLYPKKEETPATLYQVAYLHYLHRDHLKAYKDFWKLVQDYPRHSLWNPSAFLILDILNRKADYPNMIVAAKRFLDRPNSGEKSFKPEVADILRKAELKRIGTLEASSQFKEAADAYLAYSRTYGAQDESLHEKAIYNASVCLTKAGRISEALDTQEVFLRKFPKSQFREDLLLQLAKSYESIAEFGKAGFYFETFSREFPRNRQAKEALRVAGLYYLGTGEPGKAENAFKFYLNNYPRDKEAVERDLLALYTETEQHQKRIEYLLQARSEKGLPLSRYLDFTLQIIELQKLQSGKVQQVLIDEADLVVLKHSKTLAETSRGLKLLAQTKLRQTEAKQKLFDSIRLVLPQKNTEVFLAKKLRLLKELESDLHQVASLGGEEALAAVYKTARFYYDFSQEVMEAPVPADLTAEQLDVYREELAKQMIQPFKEKALGFVNQCLEKATEHQILSSWNVLCLQLGNKLDPDNHPHFQTYTLAPFYIGLGTGNSFAQSSSFFRESLKERGLAQLDGGPQIVSLQALNEEEEQEGSESKFIYFNKLRLANPSKAVRELKAFFKEGNHSPAYTNLLALAAMESGDYAFAKTVWLSLIARGESSPETINNLGVLETLKGNRASALSYFLEAHQQQSKEASINLGLIALRFHNGPVAQTYFEFAPDSLLSQIGLTISRIQNKEFEKAKEELQALYKAHPSNPWIQLSLSALGEEPADGIRAHTSLHTSETSELPELD